MTEFEALILGLIQGLTEFLPISSSGHLELTRAFLGINSSEGNLLFTVVVHGATVLSTLVVFRKDIWQLVSGLFAFKWNQETKYITFLAVSSIPIALVGLFYQEQVEQLFGNILLVGSMLWLTGIILAVSNKAPNTEKKMNYIPALFIGISQVFAILPGISRSGATIASALLLGIKKHEAARFSFLMVLVPILAANVRSLAIGEIQAATTQWGILLIGFITAFISGFIACKWMISIVQKGRLIYFAYYCFLIGTIAIIAYFL